MIILDAAIGKYTQDNSLMWNYIPDRQKLDSLRESWALSHHGRVAFFPSVQMAVEDALRFRPDGPARFWHYSTSSDKMVYAPIETADTSQSLYERWNEWNSHAANLATLQAEWSYVQAPQGEEG